MATEALPFTARPLGPLRAVVDGGLVVGVLDGLDAIVVWVLRGSNPTRVFQGIASGLLGRSSFNGGLPTALLGLALHFFIAFCVVTTYFLASRRIAVLTRRPVVCGIAYGILVFAFMHFVVIPLSAIGRLPSFTPTSLANQLFAHTLLVGLPAALFAARVPRDSPPA